MTETKNWLIQKIEENVYKITNLENGKMIAENLRDPRQKTYLFQNLKKIGFNKTERGKILTEIENLQDPKIKKKEEKKITEQNWRFLFEQRNLGQQSVEVLTKLALKKRGEATETIVKNITQEKYIYTTRDDERAEMWIYHEGIYIPQAKTYIKEYCRQVLGNAYTTSLANDVIAKIETDTYIDQKKFFSEKNLEEIATKNCLLNVVTKETRNFTPKEIFFNKIPIEFDEDKDCPAIKKHFVEVLKNSQDLPVIQELFGFLLLKEYRYEKAFMFIGTGRNGKGKTIDLMKSFLGPENCASVPLQQFEDDNFAKGEMFKKMANLAGDLDSRALKHTGSLKTLTGRDLISAARKFLPRVHFVNYAKMVFAANQIPQTYDLSPAFFMRWIMLEFPYTFLTEEEINNLAIEEQTNCKIRDPEISKKIQTEEELSGLLNFALEGLGRLIKKKDFSYSKSTEEVKKMWIRKSDSFAAFLMDCVVEDHDSITTKQELRFAYGKYCQDHKLKMVSDKSIKHTLTTTYAVSEDREKIEGERVYLWHGIKLVEDKDELEKWLDKKVQEEQEKQKEEQKNDEIKKEELEKDNGGNKPIYDLNA
jgi:putative DNA primase/helicase